VRAAASNGLVDLETPELVGKLVARLEHTPSASPERVAIVNVLARVRSDVPVPLLQAVLQGDDLLSADAAALGLARRWNDSAIGQLIRMAEQNRNPRAAIRQLQILSSWSNAAESYAEQASNYKGWYKVNSTGRPLTWFRDALTTRGYDTSVLNELVRTTSGTGVPVVDDSAIPLLLRALRDEEWYLRRNASFLLNRRIGPGAPKAITYSTRQADAEARIAEYNAWWSMEQKRKSATKRG
jgi:HEAT repeat protein